jgi:hypothetical protein
MNQEKTAKPAKTVAARVIASGGLLSARRSTIGSDTRSSTAIHVPASSADPVKSRTIGAEPQPLRFASVSASISIPIARASSVAPAASNPEWVRTCPAGTVR